MRKFFSISFLVITLFSAGIYFAQDKPEVNSQANPPSIAEKKSGNPDDEIKVKSLSLAAPIGGEVWKIGNTKVIRWNSSEIDFVRIALSSNAGITWKLVADNLTASLGQYSWNIASGSYNSSSETRISIFDTSDPAVTDTSANFILSNLVVTSPAAAEKIQVGEAYDIKWTASSDIANLKIEYSLNGTTWTQISASTVANLGNFSWTVPNFPSATARIRLTALINGTEITTTSQLFNISSVQLTSPNGGEDWFSGVNKTILWASNNVTKVALNYSTDNGTTWMKISDSVNAGIGSYIWNVPYTPSNNVRVKINDYKAISIDDISDNVFKISTVQVVSPNGSDGWEVGSSQNITCNTNIVDNFKIDLSTNNGSSWDVSVINSVASSLGSYTYTVPSLPTNNARIRISGITNPTLIDVSDNKFTIGTVTVSSPVGGEIWQAGTVKSIKWTVSNGINAVKIEYSQDGLTWTTITPTTNALAGNYNWSIPSSLSANTVRIRVSDAATGLGINNVSNLFTIAKLTLTTPNGGELWESGTSQNIQWSASASLTNIRIQYSTNAGGSWSNIASNVPAVNNSYAWNIPTDIGSASMRVKLFAENDSTFFTTSGFNFKVAKVSLISPNGGERLFANSPHVVSWTATSGIDFVTLQYSTNGGVSFINIANRINASQGSYSWTVPDISSSTGKVRIYDSFGSSISDVSETDFSIARIKVTSPNGGEGFLIGSNQKIKWTASLVDNVKIDYSLDNGTTWINIQNGVAASADSITWITPAVATSTGLVRVSDINNSNHSDKSDANFKIANIEVVSPNGGERLASARTQTITWNNSTNITSVNIDLSTNNGTSWINVSSSVPATGTYSWSVGDIASSNSIIRITDASNTNIFDRSDAVFTLKKLLLTSPNGNEYYLVDTTTSVSWSSLGVSNVKLEYSTNSGVTWKSIINSTPAVPNNYSWKIPNDPSTTALVRALDVDDPTTVADTSNNSFIINQVLLVSPNGGQTFEVGSVQTIKWNNYSGVSKVDLEFFNGNSWSAIASGLTASNKSYQWTVPASVTSTAKVRVKNTDDSNVFDGSDNVFSIGTINLTAPNGGGKYLVGKSTNITWKNIISVSQVNLDYSIDNGTTWISIAAGITASKETYTWTIPNTPSTQVLVRISDASNSAVNDLSENTFSIATITLTAPNGGEKIQVGKNFAVTWTSENVSFVNVEYSTDNGLTWATISSNVNAGAGILQWTVQNTPSSNALVRITDASFNTVTDRSDAIFDILYLNLTAPDGGEKLLVGTQSNITWSSNNSISKVNIEYTTNNGNSWTSIQTGVTASLGTYDWTVPNTPSTSVKVQVVDQNNPTIIDASANVLTIAALKLNAPNGGEKIQVGKNYPITWTSQNISTINIEYSTDNGVSWTTISSGVNTGAGILQWAVLNTPSSNALVRITDAAFSSVTDRSDSIFSILALELASPNGGEKYLVGNQTDITWNNSSSISQVNLEYSTNSGTSWISIQSGLTASTQKYTWTIPNTTSTNVYVRVADANNTSVLDASDDKFTIAKLAVTSP
ncbi:MAG: GPI anchored serine-threonine rich family protein, partial [Bacteroidetes bacterium]|nr:GPI anchored serine-threonine rich family protein [Bacteroidota bacterium]